MPRIGMSCLYYTTTHYTVHVCILHSRSMSTGTMLSCSGLEYSVLDCPVLHTTQCSETIRIKCKMMTAYKLVFVNVSFIDIMYITCYKFDLLAMWAAFEYNQGRNSSAQVRKIFLFIIKIFYQCLLLMMDNVYMYVIFYSNLHAL